MNVTCENLINVWDAQIPNLLVEQENYHCFEQTAEQTSVDVQAMQTYYTFICGPVDLKLTFTAPDVYKRQGLLCKYAVLIGRSGFAGRKSTLLPR